MSRRPQYNLDALIWKNRGDSRNTGCPHIAALIRTAREVAGLSIEDLAAAMDIDAARVSIWETGTEGMGRNDIEAVRSVLADIDFSAVRYRPTPHHGEVAHIPPD